MYWFSCFFSFLGGGLKLNYFRLDLKLFDLKIESGNSHSLLKIARICSNLLSNGILSSEVFS